MKEENIIYPSLVEESYQIALAHGVHKTKAQIYKTLVKSGMIDPNGDPTESALKAGLVSEYSRVDDGNYQATSLAVFKQDNPMYAGYADSHFTWLDDQGWAVDAFVVRGIANDVLNNPDSTPEQRQTAYEQLEYTKHME
jgi:hypothetical protein